MKKRKTKVLPHLVSLMCHIPQRNLIHIFLILFLPYVHARICCGSYEIIQELLLRWRISVTNLNEICIKHQWQFFICSILKARCTIIEEVSQNFLSTSWRLLLLNCINVTEILLRTNELLCWKLVLFIVSLAMFFFFLYSQLLGSGDLKAIFMDI